MTLKKYKSIQRGVRLHDKIKTEPLRDAVLHSASWGNPGNIDALQSILVFPPSAWISIIPKMHFSKCKYEPIYFLANDIFIAFDGVILNPFRADLAVPACTSFSNSTNAISCLLGTNLTSLNPGNLQISKGNKLFSHSQTP